MWPAIHIAFHVMSRPPCLCSLNNRTLVTFYCLVHQHGRPVLCLLCLLGLSENLNSTRRLVLKKNCFSAWASRLNMGLINKVDMVCLSPVGYGV